MSFESGYIIDNRFLLKRQLGRGSFGEVWLAEDKELGIDVAVKIYIALDSRGLEEFKTEFKNVRHLNHPNLLRPDHYDLSDNNPYLIMAYCPSSLGTKIGEMSEAEAWKMVKDVSRGLMYLHEMDIVHRDIKPDNILQNEEGAYVISDFGLSQKMRSTLRRASARNNQNNKDSFAGTVGYMAPEMFSSKPEAVKATDVWALGATLYEAITGEMPFCGQGGVMELHGAELPDLPSNYSKALTDLMHRCLAKEPWDRPSAKEINEIAIAATGGGGGNSTGGTKKITKDQRDETFKLQSEIIQLKEELKKAQSGAPGAPAKPKKTFKILFWIALPLFLIMTVLFIIACVACYETEQRRIYYSQQYDKAHSALVDINYVLDGEMVLEPEFFGSWTSTNHSHSSNDYQYYKMDAFEGDVLSFDYDVDSESYDHFIATLESNNMAATKIKDVSGIGKTGHVDYVIPADGRYTLELKYSKDSSIHSGRDRVTVNDVTLTHAKLGAVSTIISNYYQQVLYGDEVVEEVVEEYPYEAPIDSIAFD